MTERNLELYLGKNIAAICPFKYVGKNNCAHYVGHVLNLQIGILCSLTRRKQPGRASILSRRTTALGDLPGSGTRRGTGWSFGNQWQSDGRLAVRVFSGPLDDFEG